MSLEAGTTYENMECLGYDHLVEHWLPEGTKSHKTYRNLKDSLTMAGGRQSEAIGRESVNYDVKTPHKENSMPLHVLDEILNTPKLELATFDGEKQVILDEIDEHLDSPDDHVWDLAYKLMYGHQPFGVSLSSLGTRESIIQASPENVITRYCKQYQPSNMKLVVAGNIKASAIFHQAEEFFGKKESTERIVTPNIKFNNRVNERVLFEDKNLNQIHVTATLTHDMLKRHSNLVLPLEILDYILHRKVFDALVSKGKLAYTAYSVLDLYATHGYIGASFSVNPLNIEKALVKLMKALQSNITRRDLAIGKATLKRVKTLDLADTDDFTEFIIRQRRTGNGEVCDPDKISQLIEQVKLEEVLDLHEAIRKKTPEYKIAAIGPITDLIARRIESAVV